MDGVVVAAVFFFFFLIRRCIAAGGGDVMYVGTGFISVCTLPASRACIKEGELHVCSLDSSPENGLRPLHWDAG